MEIEDSLKEKSIGNETGIKFLPIAHKRMINVRDIKIENTGETIDAILAIIEKVRIYEAKRRGLPIEQMPISKADIAVKKLSDTGIPTVEMYEEDGRIKMYLNENFVKIMHKLKLMGLSEESGAILGPMRRGKYPRLGNFWSSVVYSMVINELRGHVKFDDGVATLNLDEEWAQGERGDSHLLVNLAATLFFWLGVVEEGSRLHVDEMRKFIKEHPQVFRNIGDWQIGEPLNIVTGFWYDLKKRKTINPVILYRKTIKDIALPASAEVFRNLSDAKTSSNKDDLESELPNENPEMIRKALAILLNLGVIVKIHKIGDRILKEM